jgi:hypothetical protein
LGKIGEFSENYRGNATKLGLTKFSQSAHAHVCRTGIGTEVGGFFLLINALELVVGKWLNTTSELVEDGRSCGPRYL